MDEVSLEISTTKGSGQHLLSRTSEKGPISPGNVTNGAVVLSSPPQSPMDSSQDTELPRSDTCSPLMCSLHPETWHPHNYSKPPTAPTPFTINDILSWDKKPIKLEDEPSESSSKSSPRLYLAVDSGEELLPGEEDIIEEAENEDEPLNLCVKRETSTPSPETNNNSRLLNDCFTPLNIPHRDSKSSSNALLPNNVIIPKVKHPRPLPVLGVTKADKNGNKGV